MLITNASLITWGPAPQVLPDQALRLAGDRIAAIGPSAILQAEWPDEDLLDAHGQYVMPGNLCAHTHFYGAFARGLAIPGDPPKDFPEILARLWWKLDKALTLDDVRYSALVCLVDAIKHGTTTLIDHHASPNAIDGSLDVIAEAVSRPGCAPACAMRSATATAPPAPRPASSRTSVFQNPPTQLPINAKRANTPSARCWPRPSACTPA